jgi:hypothetical protein
LWRVRAEVGRASIWQIDRAIGEFATGLRRLRSPWMAEEGC